MREKEGTKETQAVNGNRLRSDESAEDEGMTSSDAHQATSTSSADKNRIKVNTGELMRQLCSWPD